MASATYRLIENGEDDSSHTPPLYHNAIAFRSSENLAYQPIITTNVFQRPQVESPIEAPASIMMTPQISQQSHMTLQESRDIPARVDTANSLKEPGAESTAMPLLARSPTPETTRPGVSPLQDSRSDSASSVFRTGLEHVRSKFCPSDHSIRSSTPARWSKASSFDSSLKNTARPYKFKRQTWRLWRLALGEFAITFVLCSMFVTTVIYYDRKDIMYPYDQAWFNALSLGIIFLLGASIAGSFRSYAKLLRWRILAFRYRDLETFDLVLNCDSLANVFKLLYKGGRRGQEGKGFMRYVPTLIQFCCACWIVLKVTALFLVGYAGSLASLEVGRAYIGSDLANTTTTNFAVLGGIDSDAKLSRMQTWASRGFRYTGSQGLDYDSAHLSTFSTLHNGTAAYWPKAFDPSDHTIQAVSYRQIRADAFCTVYTVIEGRFGNQSSITYIDDNGVPTNYSLPKSALPGPGGFLASSHIKSACGPRCINIDAFLAQTIPGIPITNPGRKLIVSYEQAKFFKCNNTIGPVLTYDGVAHLDEAPEEFALNDSWAQMAAGTIGWQTELRTNAPENIENGRRPTAMFVSYPAWSEVGAYFALHYPSMPNATNMADVVASVPMTALAAADDSTTGLQIFNSSIWYPPIRSQNLVVEESTLIAVVGAIVLSQFMALVAVFVFANGAPIKDDSPISLAKFYHTFLEQHGFGKGGSLLSGKDIIDIIGNPNVKYGWTDREGEIRHIGILEEDIEQQDKRASCVSFGDRKTHYIYD